VDPDLELATASLGGLVGWRPRRWAPPGAPCLNCATPLAGPYCHACGQLAENFRRSIWSLVGEAIEHFFDADGRILFTLPRLLLRPAGPTRDYLAGKRASQMPPLRLFLVVVVVFFLAGSLRDAVHPPSKPHVKVTPSSAAQHTKIDLGGNSRLRALGAWLNPRVEYSSTHPREFAAAMESWAHRAAIIFLPISTLLLALLFMFRRRFFLFDHAIFSMHSLSFMGLLATAITLLGLVPGISGLAGLLVLIAPIHLFAHMRGVYDTSRAGTLARMLLLFIFSSIAALLLFVAVLFWELTAIAVPAA
jgi:hypothetical protein